MGEGLELVGQFSRNLTLPRFPWRLDLPEGQPWRDLQRFGLAVLWSLKPPRLYGVPATLAMIAAHYAGPDPKRGALPDPEDALRHPDGLAGICTDMSVPTLLAAYAKGLFPFSHIGPQKWWAPKERMVAFSENVHIQKTLRRLIRIKQYRVTFDADFRGVIEACAEPRPARTPLTWITPEIIKRYTAMHAAGHAHSVEVWDRDGNLAGGLYGLAVGRVFFTESMFSRERDASKVGFVTLSCHLQRWGFVLNDGKHMTGHLSQLGFTLVKRRAFNALLAKACHNPPREGRWAVDESIDVASWDPRSGSVSRMVVGRGLS